MVETSTGDCKGVDKDNNVRTLSYVTSNDNNMEMMAGGDNVAIKTLAGDTEKIHKDIDPEP